MSLYRHHLGGSIKNRNVCYVVIYHCIFKGASCTLVSYPTKVSSLVPVDYQTIPSFLSSAALFSWKYLAPGAVCQVRYPGSSWSATGSTDLC